MAQHFSFYKNHGEIGIKFYNELVKTNLIDSKIGYPIHQIYNKELLNEYKNVISYKRCVKILMDFYERDPANNKPVSKEVFYCYQEIKSNYLSKLTKYHKERVK